MQFVCLDYKIWSQITNCVVYLMNFCFHIYLYSFVFNCSLECQVKAVPHPKVTWYLNGLEILPSNKHKVIEKGTCHTVMVLDVKPEDAGEYVCKAENILGEMSSSTTLVVTSECLPTVNI